MLGKIKNLIDNQSNPVYPISVADAIFVDKDTNLTDKLKTLNSNGTYTVELDRWGFKTGFPSKPYQLADYQKANMNVTAFNNVLDFASRNGYQHILMPKGNYPICYPNSIMMTNNVTLNLNGSKIKVIYDSDNRSPYDTSNNAIYSFCGNAFTFSNVTNSHIINGVILGDAYDRSWSNSAEASVESSYGVTFMNGSSYCSVEHCKISAFMGDNISFSSSGISSTGDPSGLQLGDIDINGNVITGSTNTIVTGLNTIPTGGYVTWTMGGQGYARQTSLNNKEFDVHYYKADGTYLGKFSSMRVMSPIQIPSNAAKYRLKFYNETDPTKELNIFHYWGGIPTFNNVEYCELFFGHRGGISSGGSYCTIQRNWIHDNGGAPQFLTGQPMFPDTTKYAINQEDSYGDNTIIKDNLFSGGYHGILIRGYSAFIENNVFFDIGSGSAVVVYDQNYITIRGNFMRRCGITLYGAGGQKVANVNISNNYMYKGFLKYEDTYEIIAENNYFVDTPAFTGDKAMFKSNIFRYSDTTITNYTVNLGNRATGNVFMADTGYLPIFYVTGTGSFNNEFINIQFNNNRTDGTPIIVDGCKFTNSKLISQNNNSSFNINNSKFIDSTINPSNVNGAINACSCIITNCTFEANTITYFIHPEANYTKALVLTVDSCTFTIKNSSFISIISPNFTIAQLLTSTIKNNTFQYTGSSSLMISLYSSDNIVYKSYMFNNKYNLVIFTGLSGSQFIFYNPDTTGTTPPSSGYFNVTDVYKNATPSVNGYVGWVCLTTGIANNTSWTTSTSFSNGDRISSGGRVYEAQNAGTTSKATPTFPPNTGDNVLDNTGTSIRATQAYNVGDVVVPSVSNGFYYECLTAGTAGNEVDSLTISSAPTVDGNVTVALNGVSTNIAVTTGVAEVQTLTLSGTSTNNSYLPVTVGGILHNIITAVNDTAGMVGDKIRATAWSGWTVGGTPGSNVVTFTKNTKGSNSAPSITTTFGISGTFAATVLGVDPDTATTVATKIRNTAFSGWNTGGTGTRIDFGASTSGAKATPSFSGGTTGVAGTISVTQASGSTPTFPTTAGATIMDGSVNWITRAIITWKNVGNQATFKPYGLISN